jgi:hypothetical protein
MNTVNQQQTVSEVELAWLAGFLEGDGSMQLTLVNSPKGAKGKAINVWVSFDNTDASVINRIIDILDRYGVGHYDGQKFIKPVYKQDGSFYQSKIKICLFVRISKIQSVLKVLSGISPYLTGQKKGQAEIMMRFARKRLEAKGRKEYESADLMIVREFIEMRDGRFAAKNLELLDRMLNDCTSDAA